MKTNPETSNQREGRENSYHYIPGSWISLIVYAITKEFTNVVTAAVTVIVTITVILGGMWLAYIYLPANIFLIVLVVVIADLILGVVLRALFSDK